MAIQLLIARGNGLLVLECLISSSEISLEVFTSMDEKLKLLKSADSRNFYLKNRTTRTTIEIEFVFKESNFIRTEINVLMTSVIIELNGGASGGEFPLGSVKCLSL